MDLDTSHTVGIQIRKVFAYQMYIHSFNICICHESLLVYAFEICALFAIKDQSEFRAHLKSIKEFYCYNLFYYNFNCLVRKPPLFITIKTVPSFPLHVHDIWVRWIDPGQPMYLGNIMHSSPNIIYHLQLYHILEYHIDQ